MHLEKGSLKLNVLGPWQAAIDYLTLGSGPTRTPQ